MIIDQVYICDYTQAISFPAVAIIGIKEFSLDVA